MTAISMADKRPASAPLWPLGLLAVAGLLMIVSPLIYIPRWILIPVLVIGCFMAWGFSWYWMLKAPTQPDAKQALLRKRVIDGLKGKNG